jgi:hypothetical protein
MDGSGLSLILIPIVVWQQDQANQPMGIGHWK